ncbi:MAG: Lrp/AsnC family transcriptional regulator [Wujia sp.]
MDKIDMKILRCLRDNARLTASAIGEQINLSVSAVIDRIRKLESNGVIKGYTIDIDQSKLGNNMVALMEVSLKHPDYYDEFVSLVQRDCNIASCFYQTGEFDFVLHIVTDSTDGLEQVYKKIKGFEGVSRTETHFVLKTVKEEASVLPEE